MALLSLIPIDSKSHLLKDKYLRFCYNSAFLLWP